MEKVLLFVGRDGCNRPVYKDEKGDIWKDIEYLHEERRVLHSCVNNDFEGEPNLPMEKDIKIIFIPCRMSN